MTPVEPGVCEPGSTGGGGGGGFSPPFEVGGGGVSEVADGDGWVVVGWEVGTEDDVGGRDDGVGCGTDVVVEGDGVTEVLVSSSFSSSLCFSSSCALPSAVDTEPRLASTLSSFSRASLTLPSRSARRAASRSVLMMAAASIDFACSGRAPASGPREHHPAGRRGPRGSRR